MLIGGLVVLWLTLGFLRSPSIAREYLAASEFPKRVSDVQVSAYFPIPPFWIVQLTGTVTESTGVHYTSARMLGVEPIFGFVISLGAG